MESPKGIQESDNFQLLQLSNPDHERFLRGLAGPRLKGSHVFDNIIDYVKNRLSCKSILIENKYIDMDYRNEFSNFYSKAFIQYENYSIRIHFFSNPISKISFFKDFNDLALIFDIGCTKPNDDEVMMNLAYTMSLKSNCISRQVGAVIVGREGYIVGAGWNDVGEGKISCGLREIKDLEIGWYKNYVDTFKSIGVKRSISRRLFKDYTEGMLKPAELERFCFCFKDKYAEIKHKKGAKGLQYCESLHAEENAIIQGSKIGGMGLKGGKIYTTAFPCELCAKKLQQVGIKEIIYTEPYPGNISTPIFLKSAGKKIKQRPFEGVMPHGYFNLFKVVNDQKEWQKMYSEGFVH